MHQTRTRPNALLAMALAAATLAAVGMAGCRGERTDKPPRQLFPDMDDQPRFKPQRGTEFFADGRTQRPAVPGTVAYGRSQLDVSDPAVAETSWAQHYAVERARLVKDDPAVYFGSTGADAPADAPEAWVATIPVPVTRELIDLGRKNFNIYCATCHGYEGDGQGPVGVRWSVPVANFYDEKYRDGSQLTGRDGYLFHVARNGLYDPNGVLRMPGYKHAIDEREAWGVVAYIRALQTARGVSIDDPIVPDAERQRINQQWGTPVSAAPESTSEPAGDSGTAIAEGGEQ
ncbi:MAG: c-type cytochrome [Phycisphaerales bacterium]